MIFESLIGLEALWLLLPVAAGTGWLAARGATRRTTRKRESGGLRSDYFQGINYLLNEQPDKAIEVFIKLIEVDSETRWRRIWRSETCIAAAATSTAQYASTRTSSRANR